MLPNEELLKELKKWIKKKNYSGNKTIFEFFDILVEFLKEKKLYDKKLEKFYADQLKKECLSKTCGNYDKWKENYSYCNISTPYPNFKIRYKCEKIKDKIKCDEDNLCYFKDKKCIPLETWCGGYNDKLNCEKARNKGIKRRCFWHNKECYEANKCFSHDSKINCKSDKYCFVTKNDDSWRCRKKTRACVFLDNHKENCLNPIKDNKCFFGVDKYGKKICTSINSNCPQNEIDKENNPDKGCYKNAPYFKDNFCYVDKACTISSCRKKINHFYKHDLHENKTCDSLRRKANCPANDPNNIPDDGCSKSRPYLAKYNEKIGKYNVKKCYKDKACAESEDCKKNNPRRCSGNIIECPIAESPADERIVNVIEPRILDKCKQFKYYNRSRVSRSSNFDCYTFFNKDNKPDGVDFDRNKKYNCPDSHPIYNKNDRKCYKSRLCLNSHYDTFFDKNYELIDKCRDYCSENAIDPTVSDIIEISETPAPESTVSNPSGAVESEAISQCPENTTSNECTDHCHCNSNQYCDTANNCYSNLEQESTQKNCLERYRDPIECKNNQTLSNEQCAKTYCPK